MNQPVQGGQFLLTPVGDSSSFIPEELPSELVQLRDAARDFIDGEVSPRDDDIESKVAGVMPELLKKAGALGFMMAETPGQYGGAALGKVAATAIAEGLNGQGSFTVAYLCHTGIGTLPLLHYGNADQKERYLSKLASGEMLASYALTEANSGSDALAARANARKSEDGSHYILNGEKMFITNGGFADLFTVFAKVDGEHFSAFLVERTMPGVSVGPEEKKMGVHGSSTVPLILQDVKVPAENLLGEEGRGHKIAFNTLNVGRWKLGAGVCGAAKRLIEMAVKYVKERQQFGKSLSEFELMQQKVADLAINTFLIESLVYRYAHDLDSLHATLDQSAEDYALQQARKTEELVIEASICKVFCSEAMHSMSDEAVQMLGGYGYIQEYQAERHYRDNRINRIWEGTNEINRMLIPGTIFKRMLKGEIDLLGELQVVLAELKQGFAAVDPEAPFAPWQDMVNQLKKLVVYVGGVAGNTYGPDIQHRQQVLVDMADLCIAAYAADSAMCRLLKLHGSGADTTIPALMVQSYLIEHLPKMKAVARQALANIAQGDPDVFHPYHKAVKRFLRYTPFDLCTAKSKIAETITQHGAYRW